MLCLDFARAQLHKDADDAVARRALDARADLDLSIISNASAATPFAAAMRDWRALHLVGSSQSPAGLRPQVVERALGVPIKLLLINGRCLSS